MIKRRAPQLGFTIVELLIVIVVIGILAAITIVAYNGIQARAENTKTINAMSQYMKGFNLYAADNGSYPIETGYPCLGVYPGTSCNNVIDGTAPCFSTGTFVSASAFDTKMKTVFPGGQPQPSTQQMNCGGKNWSGAFYHSGTDGKTATAYYFLRGNQPCDGVQGAATITKLQGDDTTRCQLTLIAL